jgi:hypothetical protein
MAHLRRPLFWLLFPMVAFPIYFVFGWLALFGLDALGNSDSRPFSLLAMFAGQAVALAAAGSIAYFTAKSAATPTRRPRGFPVLVKDSESEAG